MDTFNYHMGWLPDYPDFRDYTIENENIKPMIKSIGIKTKGSKNLPTSIDLRQWCSPIEDQGQLGSCTAHAAVGAVEYFERKAFEKHIDASRLFLYKTTRNLLHLTGDTGAFIRTTIAALVLFGVPPEEYYPYNISDFDKEPSAFCYAFAQNYQTVKYLRLDPPEVKKSELLTQIKSFLSSGIPLLFGFTVYSSINQAKQSGLIPYPTKGEKILGGHAILAVGYNDNLKILNTNSNQKTIGAILKKLMGFKLG